MRKVTLGLLGMMVVALILGSNYFFDSAGTSSVTKAVYIEEQQSYEVHPAVGQSLEVEEKKEEKPPEKITASIVAVGDIMLHRPQIYSAYQSEMDTYYFDPVFEKVLPYIESADIAIGNFETVTAGPEHGFSGYPTFNSPKSILKTLKNSGFDLMSTMNNHSIDMGKEGIIETIDNMNGVGLEHIGTYKEPTDEIMIKDVNGIKIAFLAYAYGTNGLEHRLSEEELSYMVSLIEEEKIKEDIEGAEEQGVDLVTVIMHWGHEYHRQPSEYQTDLAGKMMDWGADIILGSHPHVIQKSEMIQREDGDKFVIYSMGNFISNQRRETLSHKNGKYTEDGVMVTLEVEKDPMTNKTAIKNVDYIPTWVHKYRAEGKNHYEILPTTDYLTDEDWDMGQPVMDKIRASYNQTIELMYKRKDTPE